MIVMLPDAARPLSALAAAGLLLALSACGAGAAGSSDGRLSVVASFYPLQYAAEQVGGDLVRVSSLTKPGAEPHDLELTPRDIVRLTKADLVVYEKGFQPAVDDAVAQAARRTALDVSAPAHLDLYSTETGHTDESAAGHAARGSADPHFWLDPVRYAAVGEAIAAQLERLDPAHTSDYRTRAAGLAGRLHTLDAAFTKGLAHCTNRRIVTSHAAFGYLAKRYGFVQEAIAGVSPDSEPTASTMRDLARQVRESGASTLYAETLVSPVIAETVAREAGAKVAILDPVEGITDASAGRDYFEVMRANLATLRAGQGCS
jgi:zinc transport system substrate-binding protein